MRSPKRAVVVIPVWCLPLTADESLSLERCLGVLSGADFRLVSPASLDLAPLFARHPGLSAERFADRHFRRISGYNELLLSDGFYARFAAWEYMLICQLDAMPLSDELVAWCERGLDYAGAPWFATGPRNRSGEFIGAGNGGFSLRRIAAFRRVLASRTLDADPDKWNALPVGFGLRRILLLRLFLLLRSLPLPFARLFLACARMNEDLFWSAYARFFDPDFRVCGVDEALRFAFECQPRLCYERSGRRLPFGCHAWFRYDPAFWRNVLEGRDPLAPRFPGP